MNATETLQALTITETLTTPSRPGKRPRPVWVVAGDTQGLDEALRDLGGRKYQGAWSFFADPTDDLAQLTDADRQTFAEQRQTSAERAADRAERFEGYARNAAARSEAAFDRGRQAVAGIPFGQPILVGHHSEKRHRRDLARSQAAATQGLEEHRKAEHWEQRAEGTSRNATPDAERCLGFLQRRLDEAETEWRKAERELTRDRSDDYPPGGVTREQADADYRHRWEGIRTDAGERAEYWRGLIEARGGVRYSPDSIAKGDLVKSRHGWERVVRVNAKTVSTASLTVNLANGEPWPGKCPYAEILDHRAAEEQVGQLPLMEQT